MPDFQALLGHLNNQFSKDNVTSVRAEAFESSLVEAAGSLDLDDADKEAAAEAVRMMPEVMQEALRAFIHSNLKGREGPLPVTFAWIPASADQMTVYPGPKAHTVLLQIPALHA